jgi:hypothetical protein
MRIQYTLPKMQPFGSDRETIESGPGPFRNRLRRISGKQAPNWKQILRLNEPSYTAATIGPPPKPVSVGTKDVAFERLRWRRLIAQEPPASGDGTEVQRMFALLRAYQSMEDRVVSRYLAEARG